MKRFISPLALALTLACASAQANFSQILLPTPQYVSGTSLVPFTGADFTTILSSTDGTQVLSYSVPLTVLTVPPSWSTWNFPPFVESSTPRVADTPLTGPFSLTISLSVPSYTFGFELEPDEYVPEEVVAQFFNSGGPAGTIDTVLAGNGGARLFAATSSTSPFTSVTITDLYSDDFAIAQQRYGPTVTPEPSLIVPGVCLGLAIWIGRRRLLRERLAG
jgi:hypothetical protein